VNFPAGCPHTGVNVAEEDPWCLLQVISSDGTNTLTVKALSYFISTDFSKLFPILICIEGILAVLSNVVMCNTSTVESWEKLTSVILPDVQIAHSDGIT
jgi:hypothetical protein